MSQMLKTIWSHEKVKEVKSVLVSVEEVKDVRIYSVDKPDSLIPPQDRPKC